MFPQEKGLQHSQPITSLVLQRDFYSKQRVRLRVCSSSIPRQCPEHCSHPFLPSPAAPLCLHVTGSLCPLVFHSPALASKLSGKGTNPLPLPLPPRPLLLLIQVFILLHYLFTYLKKGIPGVLGCLGNSSDASGV